MHVSKVSLILAVMVLLSITAAAHGQRARAGVRAIAPRAMGAQRAFGVPRQVFPSRGVIAARPVVVPRVIAPRVFGPRVIVSRFQFAQPFFTFRPRFNLGFGLWAGFPVAYPYPYVYSYPYPYPYAYSYSYDSAYAHPSYAPPGVQPGGNASGVSFEITPNMAGVYIGGMYVGTAAEFSPSHTPLTLTPGRHHIELRAAGYQTMSFDTDVMRGEVIPYRGEMQPQR